MLGTHFKEALTGTRYPEHQDTIYIFPSDFLYLVRATTLPQIRPLKVAGRTCSRCLEGDLMF